ncbi:hypothetical protein [Williamsia muralis]|uniref:hypothetical protein n=1 Tax=Williamsia marianensis TaxID=85044 RepID=UPI000DB664B1|nr:hypothetical protein [Williamsia marianensis]PVY23635.1 hypothetical protein C7458_1236 [Williamsia marianensis]PZT97508.1 MAG: hypothetical protein DI630_21415 [Gordonia sp. (in: high G+C Gram-positive bacteria)]
MTDLDNAGPRQASKRARANIADLTLIVRVPGRPADVRVFTDTETDDAHQYASSVGGTVEPLATH